MKGKFACTIIVVALVGCCLAFGCGSTGAQGGSDAPSAGDSTAASYASLEEFTAAHSEINPGNSMAVAMSAMKCFSCHGMDEAALFEAYQADPTSIAVPRDKCITCHHEAAWPTELEPVYENVKDWNTYVGVGSEEHQAWVNAALQYTTGRPPMGDYEQECALCHTMHSETQTMYCTLCHNEKQGTGDCMVCHERILGPGMEFEGQDPDEVTAILMERMEANGGHISSVMHAPDGWTELPSLL